MVAIPQTYHIKNLQYRYKKNSLQYFEFLTTLFKMVAITPNYCIELQKHCNTLSLLQQLTNIATIIQNWCNNTYLLHPNLCHCNDLGSNRLKSSSGPCEVFRNWCINVVAQIETEITFHYTKHIWVHNTAPWLKYWTHVPTQQAVIKKCTYHYLHVKGS
jgi:hypothetical protein